MIRWYESLKCNTTLTQKTLMCKDRTYQANTVVCNAAEMKVMAAPTNPKLPAKHLSSAMHNNPNGAAVVGLANSSLTTGNAINNFPIRQLANTNEIVPHK